MKLPVMHTWPRMPAWFSEKNCGRHAEKWRARRRVLVRQMHWIDQALGKTERALKRLETTSERLLDENARCVDRISELG